MQPTNSTTYPADARDFLPHITVACIIEQNNRFLLVEEHAEGLVVLNQPAGHLDPCETLIQAAEREVWEETGWRVKVDAIVGLYLYTSPHNQVTYHRICFAATPISHEPNKPLDPNIIQACWLTYAELAAQTTQHRSPMVMTCLEDYLAGKRYPLTLIKHL